MDTLIQPAVRRRGALIACLAVLAATAAGCGTDSYAHRLIEYDTSLGKINLAWTGTGEQLTARHRIDAAMKIPVDDGIDLDVWVIHARPGRARLQTGGTRTQPGNDQTQAGNTQTQSGNTQTQSAGPGGTVILLHGLLDSKARYLTLGERLAGMNYDVVLVDHRAHGTSGGRYVTFGALERRDVRRVADKLLADKAIHPPLYAVGVSMGAAIAIQYASDDPRCKGVLAVAPPKDLRAIARMMFPFMGQADLEAVLKRAGEIGGFDPEYASAVTAAARLNCPLLLVHGRMDGLVPYEHSLAILAAASDDKKLVEVPLATHATILLGREAWFAQQIDRLARTGHVKSDKTIEVLNDLAPS